MYVCIRHLFAAALTAAIAGCAGGIGLQAPTAGNKPSLPSLTRMGAHGIVPDEDAARAVGADRPAHSEFQAFKFAPTRRRAGASPSYLLTSEFYTGNLYEYQESSGLDQVGEVDGAGGWGVAVARPSSKIRDGGVACVGDDYGAVQCFKVDPASGALKRISFLRLSQRTSGARAYGIAFDWSGNLYVSDFIKYVGSSTVDEYSASRVARCSNGCNPSRSLTLINFGQVYFLASDGRSIYANGYDATLKSVIVCKIALATGNCSGGPVFAFGAQAFFPGGMSFDGRHDIVINNQMAGTLIQFDAPFSPNEPVSSLFKYQSSQTPDYTAIALDRSQKNVWGANYWTCGSVTCTNAQSNTYPLGGYGALGATQTVQFVAGAWFLGVALSPAPRT